MENRKNRKESKKGAAAGDLMFFVAFVVVIAIAWIITGGPSKSPLTQGPSIVGIQKITSGKTGIQSFFAPFGGTYKVEDAFDQAREEFNKIQKELGESNTFGEVSPYWGRVSITKSSSGPKKSSVQEEFVKLNILSSAQESINITGWRLQSLVSNNSVTIGQATKVSTSGNVNIEQPLRASPRDKIYIITGHSPIGTSFQINKCSGYFEQFQDFVPSISTQCPSPEDELKFAENRPSSFGDECLDYIEDLPSCRMPLEALPLGFNNSCALFITEKINYTTCVKNHRNDSDFFEPEWRVYLKNDSELWQSRREVIRLLDENGKTVDVFSYD